MERDTAIQTSGFTKDYGLDRTLADDGYDIGRIYRLMAKLYRTRRWEIGVYSVMC